MGDTPAAALDQAIAIEHRMDGALGETPDIAIEPPEQHLVAEKRGTDAPRLALLFFSLVGLAW